MPLKIFPLKIFGYGAIYEKVPFFTEGGAADFGLSTISALLCHFNRDITTLLRRKVIIIMWRKETTTKRPCSNTITDAPQLTVKATVDDWGEGRSRAGCRHIAGIATSHRHPTLHIDPRPPMLHLQPPDQLPSRELGH